MNDAEIVARVLTGERELFGQLVSAYTPKIYRLCMSLCRDSYMAEEAVQEAFIDAYLQLSSLTEPEYFGTWLSTIARRKCFRQVRTKYSFVDIDELDELLEGEGSPEESVIAVERCEDIRRAIERLSPTLKSTVEQYYLRAMSIRQIALREGIPEATVKSRLFDGRNKLRKELAYMNELKIPENLESKIRESLAACEHYYPLHSGYDDDFKTHINGTVELIEQLAESKTKQSLLSRALQYKSYVDPDNRDELLRRSLEAAKAGENIGILTDHLIEEFIGLDNKSYAKGIEFLDSTAIPKITPYIGTPEGKNCDGQLRFWRGRSNLGLCKYDDALADWTLAIEELKKSDVYYANAISAYEQLRDFTARGLDAQNGFSATAEGLLIDGNRLIFANQPGFGGGLWTQMYHARFDSFDYFASLARRTLYDTSMKPGDKLLNKDNSDSLTVVACDETVSVAAGEFSDCLHTRVQTENWKGTIDIYYAKNVGIVKVDVKSEFGDEVYELTDYKLNGGEGYYPLALGNHWEYKNPNVPEWIYQRHEKTVEYFDGKLANLSCIDSFALAADYMDKIVGDSDGCLTVADVMCDKWLLDEAVDALKAGVRANSSDKAVKISLRGIDTIGRFAQYKKLGYRICPSSVGSSNVISENGRVINDTNSIYSFGPYRLGRRGRIEDRIFGMKPFRYQQELFGCVWSDEWVVGYSADSKIGEGAKLTVTDGGKVETPAGVFDNCRLVTIEYELENQSSDRYYFANNYRHMHCGTKRYWYAPGVGIVRIVSDWGESCHSETQLVKYNTLAARSDEYMPMHIGCSWEWAETEIEKDGYRARAIFEVASGIGAKKLVTQAQEFVWLGKEEEYNKLDTRF